MKAKVTIARRSDDSIIIEIEDAASYLPVAKVKMGMTEFAEAVTGLAKVEVQFIFTPTMFICENIGKKRETKQLHCEKVYNKNEQIKIVNKEFERLELSKDSWMIYSDGTSSRQDRKDHCFTVYRFVDADE
jgi:hypothetical protein